MIRAVLCLVPVTLAGCLHWQSLLDPEETQTATVGSNPFGHPPPAAQQKSMANFAPANPEQAKQVDFVGRKILAANGQIGMKPLFATIGSPAPEVFHKDTSMVLVTAGLVSQCKSEADLAAILSLELGKMVSEREARANPLTRNPERRPPINVPIGNSSQFSGADGTNMVEMARFERQNPRTQRRLPPPDPGTLARSYLEGAGYLKTALDDVGPFLDAAEKNSTFERQLRGQPVWTP